MASLDYYDTPRRDLLPFLEGTALDVLELGCGTGATGALLKSLGIARTVTGVEIVERAARLAEGALDRVVVGDIETIATPEGEYDLILCPDVIEHLRDPWNVLGRVVTSLRPGGFLLTCTPNTRYWRVIYDLGLRGRFEYADHGILDRTHLRFFTRRSIVQLHEQLGMTVELVAYPELSGKRRTLDRLSRGMIRDVLSGQHVVRSRRLA